MRAEMAFSLLALGKLSQVSTRLKVNKQTNKTNKQTNAQIIENT